MPSALRVPRRGTVESFAVLAGVSVLLLGALVLHLADLLDRWVLLTTYPLAFVSGIAIQRRRACPSAGRTPTALTATGLLFVLQTFNPTRSAGLPAHVQPQPSAYWKLRRLELSLEFGDSLALTDWTPVLVVSVPFDGTVVDLAYLLPGVILVWAGFYWTATRCPSADTVA